MFGKGPSFESSPGGSSNANHSTDEYLDMAREAALDGRGLLAAHLYMAAYEKDVQDNGNPRAGTVDGLHVALDLACDAGQRSLAEHIYERLEPHCSPEEDKAYTEKLQKLMLDSLEDFGFSRDDLRDMAGMFASESFGTAMLAHLSDSKDEESEGEEEDREDGAQAGKRQHSLFLPPSTPFGKIKEHRFSDAKAKKDPKKELKKAPKKDEPHEEAGKDATRHPDVLDLGSFDELIGYDAAIDEMHQRGIGLSHDERFKSFLTMLNRRHGISSLPSLQTTLFRAQAREDASHFMAATVGELGMPTIRMYMEEAPNGIPVLCIMASSDFRAHFQFMRGDFDFPMVLMLEDVDLWASQLAGVSEGFEMTQMGQLARGARETIMFIQSAVTNPNITVLASCELGVPFDGFLHELLDPCDIIDIELPTPEERAAVWKHVNALYPSMRMVNLDDLVRYSESMSRYDIYMAAREAVEQAFGQSVRKRSYVPVTRDNIFDKIAAYQPLDSQEYQELEQSVVDSFKRDLDHIDDLLDDDAR